MRRSFVVAVLATSALVASACSSGAERPATAPTAAAGTDLGTQGVAGASNAPDSGTDAGGSTPAALDAAGTAAPPDPGSRPTPGSPGRSRGSKKLPPFELPEKPKVPVSARVVPLCAERGGTVSLIVTTKPEAAVGYQAVYSDGKGGGPPPFGAGHGGNDKGFASDSGRYTSEWVVSPTAPAGRARVDVVIGYESKWGYDDPRFAVADDDGHCPRGWIGEDEGDG